MIAGPPQDVRDIKLLVLYIGLGCPAVIRFLYEYRHASDMDTAESSISNGLRRLLHLSKHDYLENKLNKVRLGCGSAAA